MQSNEKAVLNINATQRNIYMYMKLCRAHLELQVKLENLVKMVLM